MFAEAVGAEERHRSTRDPDAPIAAKLQGSGTGTQVGPELCPMFLGREKTKKGKYHPQPQTGFNPVWAFQWYPVAAWVAL